MSPVIYTEREIETDRQRDKGRKRERDRDIDRQTDRQTDRQKRERLCKDGMFLSKFLLHNKILRYVT